MEAKNKNLEQLLFAKEKLKIALDTNNKNDARRNFEKIKKLYYELTGKMFEQEISEEDLSKIKKVLNSRNTNKNIDKDIEDDDGWCI